MEELAIVKTIPEHKPSVKMATESSFVGTAFVKMIGKFYLIGIFVHLLLKKVKYL